MNLLPLSSKKIKIISMTRHIYIDESGDTTFYGRHRRPLLGSEGVSKTFIIGLLKLHVEPNQVRQQVIDLQTEIEN